MSDPVMKLTPTQARNLAYRLVADRVRFAGDEWLDWEDIPNLDERSYELVVNAAHVIADDTLALVRNLDRTTDIDSAALLNEAVR